MARKHFGTDGIRGIANAAITPELAMKAAQATGVMFQRGDYRHRAVIGKDTRLSGYMIENALVAGFTSIGVDVLLLGPMPTPAVAMLTRSMRADVGVMISASHNPYEDNGIKLFGPDGYKLPDAVEAKIEAMLDQPSSLKLSKPADLGRAMRVEGDRGRYIEFAKRTFHAILRSMVCESSSIAPMAPPTRSRPKPCGNWAPTSFRSASSRMVSTSTGSVGSTAPGALVKKVREVRADIGIALDGDADRVLIVDEAGKLVDGDQMMAAIAQSWKEDGRLSRPGIVATSCRTSASNAISKGTGCRSRAPRLAIATCSNTCGGKGLISAANNPAISSSWIIARPATDSLPLCKSWQLSRAKISR